MEDHSCHQLRPPILNKVTGQFCNIQPTALAPDAEYEGDGIAIDETSVYTNNTVLAKRDVWVGRGASALSRLMKTWRSGSDADCAIREQREVSTVVPQRSLRTTYNTANS